MWISVSLSLRVRRTGLCLFPHSVFEQISAGTPSRSLPTPSGCYVCSLSLAVGAIIGGVIGGVVLIVLLVFACRYWAIQRARRSQMVIITSAQGNAMAPPGGPPGQVYPPQYPPQTTQYYPGSGQVCTRVCISSVCVSWSVCLPACR